MVEKPEMVRIRKSFIDKLESRLADLEEKLETAKGVSTSKAKATVKARSVENELDMYGPRVGKWQRGARIKELEWVLAVNQSETRDMVTVPMADIRDRIQQLKLKKK